MGKWILPKGNFSDRYCSNCKAIVPYHAQGDYCMYCGEHMTEFGTPDGFIPLTPANPHRYTGESV